ncbi:hypothetical protein [Nostoc sp. MG11]|nr:hypothetical protein [Nostoc sp. MG11]
MIYLCLLVYPAGSPSGDAPNVANATLTAVACGGFPSRSAASPLRVYICD